VRHIFHWHARRLDTFRSPIIPGMARHPAAKHARTRTLTDDEIRKLWAATKVATPYHALIRFLLLTGARRGEAVGLPWDEIRDGLWTLPAPRNKTGVELRRPLSRAALDLLEKRPVLWALACLHRRSSAAEQLVAIKTELDRASGVRGWVTHDLRRTAPTLLARAGIAADVAEMCLGLNLPSIRRTYDRYRYEDERRNAARIRSAGRARRAHCCRPTGQCRHAPYTLARMREVMQIGRDIGNDGLAEHALKEITRSETEVSNNEAH
jgi:integrase